MGELYKRYPGKIFELQVMTTKERTRARQFWKEQGFKTFDKIGQFNIMRKKN